MADKKDNKKQEEQKAEFEPKRKVPKNFKMPKQVVPPVSHTVLPVRIPKTATSSVRNQTDGKKLVVGKNIKLNGDIDACESLVVEGQIEANLSYTQTLEIVSGGKFSGNAEVETAYISGEFDGTLTVLKSLYVYSGAFIKGKINYNDLVVESGGVIKGTLKYTGDKKKS
jgi:cytoskeletal protein CcmA (bactofilin family)